jgi:hypothetical protein
VILDAENARAFSICAERPMQVSQALAKPKSTIRTEISPCETDSNCLRIHIIQIQFLVGARRDNPRARHFGPDIASS